MTRETVAAGLWAGNPIRTARKEGRCEYWIGSGRCPVVIHPGDRYFDGEVDPYKAGGFARERWCMAHVADGTGTVSTGAEGQK